MRNNTFLHLIRLTGHSTFVRHDIHAFKHYAIGWNSHSLLYLDNVTNYQFTHWDSLCQTLSTSIAWDLINLCLSYELLELLLLDIIVCSSD